MAKVDYIAWQGKVYRRSRSYGTTVSSPCPEIDCLLNQEQAEVIAKAMTEAYNQGVTNTLNVFRAYVDQVQSNYHGKNH